MSANQNKEQLQFDDLFKIIKSRRTRILGIVGISMTVFLIAAFIAPKKYKSAAVINVYTKYFKNPLVGQVITELQNTDEIKNNLESLITESIDDKFVDAMAEKYRLYKYEAGKIKRNSERDLLRQRFQITAIGHQSFQIAFLSSDPQVAKEVAQASLSQTISHLVSHRKQTINSIKESIRKRIEFMAMSQDKVTNPLTSTKPEILKRQLVRIRAEKSALSQQYSAEHPSVKTLEAKEKIIARWLEDNKKGSSTEKVDPTINEQDQVPILGGDSAYAISEINKDLLTKYNYLNIISELENVDQPDYIGIVQYPQVPASPLFPNKLLFLVFGLLLGIVISALMILLEEYVFGKGQLIHQKVALALDVPYLGKFPMLDVNQVKLHAEESKRQKDGAKSGDKEKSLSEWN